MRPSNHPHLQSTLFMSEGHFNLSNISPFLREVPVVERFNLVKADMDVLEAKERALVNGEHSSTLTEAQRELSLIHNKMGHLHMKQLQKLLHNNLPLDSKQSNGELNSTTSWYLSFRRLPTCLVRRPRRDSISTRLFLPRWHV